MQIRAASLLWKHFALVLEDQDKKLNPRKMGIKEEEEEGKKSGTGKSGGTEQIAPSGA